MGNNISGSTVTSSENAPISQPINDQRGFFSIILGVIVLLILVASGAYYLGAQKGQTINISSQQLATPVTPSTSTQSSKLEWKTYKDKNSTFTMRYPSNFYETFETPMGDLNPGISAGALSTVKPYNNGLDKESDMLIEMVIQTLPQNMTLESYIQTNILTHPREDTDGDGKVGPPIQITPSKRKTINIGEKEAIWIEGLAFMSVSHSEVFIPYKYNEIVLIKFYDGTGGQENRNQEQYQKNIKLAEEIVSTFKFTK